MWPARLTMVDDLLSRHLRAGLPRDSVERMLGPGVKSSYWPEWDLVYLLGPSGALFGLLGVAGGEARAGRKSAGLPDRTQLAVVDPLDRGSDHPIELGSR